VFLTAIYIYELVYLVYQGIFFFQIPEASIREFFTLISSVRNSNIFLYTLCKIKANWRERLCIVICASENSENGICYITQILNIFIVIVSLNHYS